MTRYLMITGSLEFVETVLFKLYVSLFRGMCQFSSIYDFMELNL